jgi:uncharacterized membrane protein YdjX (TVP38/TMEM64 family)
MMIKFLKDYLINLALLVIALAIIYMLGADLIRTGSQFFVVILGPGRAFLFLVLLVLVAALPRRRWRR